MAGGPLVSNSYMSVNPDIPVRATARTAGILSGVYIQHVAIDNPFITYQDDVDSTTSYYGFALPGTATANGAWRIQKKTVSGTVTSYLFADGNTDFDNVWDDRASLSYS